MRVHSQVAFLKFVSIRLQLGRYVSIRIAIYSVWLIGGELQMKSTWFLPDTLLLLGRLNKDGTAGACSMLNKNENACDIAEEMGSLGIPRVK
jgi:hypothetical protein